MLQKSNHKVVYSTDPEPQPEQPKPGPGPSNPAAPWPIRQGKEVVRVQRERKGRGGKTVSIITGIKSPESGKQALLKLLKNKLGAGGTIEEDTIVIQGEHRERIVEILNELGYRAKVAGG